MNWSVTASTGADHDKIRQHTVLANDLRGTLREVQSEASLVGAKVVDVEDKLLWQVLWGAPDRPSDTRIDLFSLAKKRGV